MKDYETTIIIDDSVYIELENKVNGKTHLTELLIELKSIIKKYGSCSLADLKDILDQETLYTDNFIGWTDLSLAKVVKNKLYLPKAKELES